MRFFAIFAIFAKIVKIAKIATLFRCLRFLRFFAKIAIFAFACKLGHISKLTEDVDFSLFSPPPGFGVKMLKIEPKLAVKSEKPLDHRIQTFLLSFSLEGKKKGPSVA